MLMWRDSLKMPKNNILLFKSFIRDKLVTGSFDNTCRIWDASSGRCIRALIGHEGEISSTQFNYAGDLW